MPNEPLTDAERSAVYKTIYGRRDTRSFFKPDSLCQEVLARILKAAHHAGSVGYTQPWNFLIVEDRKIKEKIKQAFVAAEIFQDVSISDTRVGAVPNQVVFRLTYTVQQP